MTKNLLYVLIGAVVVLAGVYFVGLVNSGKPLGAAFIENAINPIFTNGLRAGKLARQIVTASGTLDAVTAQVNSGAIIDNHKCATLTTWNPASIATSGTSTQAIAILGATIGDTCMASIASSSVGAALNVTCSISASAASATTYGTSTVVVENLDVAVNFATSTLRTCYFSY